MAKFTNLPIELIQRILSQCLPQEILAASNTCHTLQRACSGIFVLRACFLHHVGFSQPYNSYLPTQVQVLTHTGRAPQLYKYPLQTNAKQASNRQNRPGFPLAPETENHLVATCIGRAANTFTPSKARGSFIPIRVGSSRRDGAAWRFGATSR